MIKMEYHSPVLLDECIEGLSINPDGIYIDATFGGGGHSKLILSKLRSGKLFAFDQDLNSIDNKLNSRFIPAYNLLCMADITLEPLSNIATVVPTAAC